VPHLPVSIQQGFKTNSARVCNRISMDFLIFCSLAPALVDLSAGRSGLGNEHPAAKHRELVKIDFRREL
jgi:hypothetical protein